MIRSFSYGGGVQSTGVLALQALGRLPDPYDVFLFCNVGDDSEHPDTIRYYHDWAVPFAEAHGIRLEMLQRRFKRGTRKGEVETLMQRLMKPDSRSLPIPVRMSENGAPGRRSCTGDFKIRLVASYLKDAGATPERPATTGLGISLDEYQRMRLDSGIPWQLLDYPLIDQRLNRRDCVEAIREAGLPVPPKSACFFCPFHDRNAWRNLKRERPDLFDKAVMLERTLNERRAMLGKDPVWLTRYGAPLDQCFADEMTLFGADEGDTCETGYCMT